jgi:hypothetical protein
MGFLDSIFGSSGGELKQAPQAKWQKEGISYLQQLLKQTPEFSAQQVAGMSPTEQAAMSALNQYVSGGDYQDPATSRYYQGLRNQSLQEEGGAIDATRQRSQLGGMFNSGGSIRAEGDVRSSFANQRLTQLGALEQAERQYNSAANRAQAGLSMGSLPRTLEQAQMDAQFQADNQNLLAKYNYNLPIAQSLMGHEPNFYQTPVQASPFAQVLGAVGTLGGTLGDVGIAGGKYGFNWWG